MEFDVFIPTNVGTSRKPSIRINRNGMLSINTAATEAIGLKEGDTVDFVREKKSQEWYLAKRSAGIFTFRKYKNSSSLCFNNSSLVNELFNSKNLPNSIAKNIEDRKSLSIPLAKQSIDGGYYALLTSAAH
jgi:hypothetical protein